SQGEESWSGKEEHGKPHGGMHTGGGALTAVNEGDWGGKEKSGGSQGEESWSGKEKSWNHDKPRGGMHTGGGGLADPGVTAGGLAVVGVVGAGLYALRRKKVSGSVA
ncbi:hypothetical protein ACFYOV_22505, partial [Streptomyces sp. NPDC005931]|uniref:hypothetical protein n=1 Tax=Streptomyces sp. NPDC005931 TaxID=3364737 RepID=UPI0036BD6010